MNSEEIQKRQDDLMEMKSAVLKLEERLNNGKFVDEIYDVGKIRYKGEFDLATEAEKVESKMSEMKEFDRILKMKSEEIKMAKLNRMRETEEYTQLLKQMSSSNVSDAIKNNSEQFIQLLESEMHENTGETTSSKPARQIRKARVEEPKNAGTFIERNIQLAKCGDGILSLTDEEKLRLKFVLDDAEDAGRVDDLTENQYVLNDDLTRVIREIDRKLEEHEKTKFPFHSIRSTEMKIEIEKEKDDKEKEKCKSKIQTTGPAELKRLKEVDKLISLLNSATNEEIDPLLEEDLQYLIEESKQCLPITDSMESLDNAEAISGAPTKETMVKLVTDAKRVMPNFRYRYVS